VPVQSGTDAHTASCTMGSGCLSGVKGQGHGVEVANGLDLHPRLHSVTGQTYHGVTFVCNMNQMDNMHTLLVLVT